MKKHTTVTSSPITSTSGLRKCFNATMPAKHAQSSIFPSSAKKCSVRRRCQTYTTINPRKGCIYASSTHPLFSKDTQRLLINRIAPPQHFIQHPRNRYLLIRRPIIPPPNPQISASQTKQHGNENISPTDQVHTLVPPSARSPNVSSQSLQTASQASVSRSSPRSGL